MRGFTIVRDLGGADVGLAQAIHEGLIEAPHLVVCGEALSQTGGHTDCRGPYHARDVDHHRDRAGSLGRVVDGVDQVRRACREEIEGGAAAIEVLAGGGVSSPTDPIAFLGLSAGEIRAAVEEARNAQTYGAAPRCTDEAIRRAVELGVVTVGHGDLITPGTARFVKERGARMVPANATSDVLAKERAALGILREAGVAMACGSDLLGGMKRRQSEGSVLRGRVLHAIEVIRSATVAAAKVVGDEGRLGGVAAGAHADLIVVDADPRADLSLITGQGRHMPAILGDGRSVEDALAA